MNKRFVKFLIALSLCLLGLYFLAEDIFTHEVLVVPFGIRVPHIFVLGMSFGVMIAGIWLARHAIIEELSVTSD